jgi:hypothetical protein
LRILRIGVMGNGDLSKIGHHFRKQIDFIKNVNNKKCAPTLIFFNEKNPERFG